MAGWIGGLIYAASEIDLWTNTQIGDTAAWILLTAIGLFGRAMSVFKEPGSFRRLAVAAITITVFVEVYANLVVFPLPVELLLFPFVTAAVTLAAAAGMNPEWSATKKLLDGVVAVVGTVILLYVTGYLLTHLSELDLGEMARRFALPVWLTLGLLPFVAALALYAHYSTAFSMIRWASDERQRRVRSRAALITGLHLRAHYVAHFNGLWAKQLAATDSFAQARAVVADFRAARAQGIDAARIPSAG